MEYDLSNFTLMVTSDKFIKIVCDNIRRLRELKGLSQKELADMMDMPAPQYSRLESGKSAPTLNTLVRIAEALSIEVEHLLISPKKANPKQQLEHKAELTEKIKKLTDITEYDKEFLNYIIELVNVKRTVSHMASSLVNERK